MKFNRSQQKAIDFTRGQMLVLAGPGSGKTTVIINRISNLMGRHHIAAENILPVTFSRAAANEMAARFPDPANTPEFGTFHSIFLKILQTEQSGSRFNIISDSQRKVFLKSEIERFKVTRESDFEIIRTLSLALSRFKGLGSDPAYLEENGDRGFCSNVPNDMFYGIYRDYQDFLRQGNLIDFDDILTKCYDLLKSDPIVLRKWQNQYRFIVIDEFQDISLLQYETIRLLGGNNPNLFIVGDDDQSIYGFRGASPSIIKKFINDYPDCSQVFLNINYRCDSGIIDASMTVIRDNNDRLDKTIVPAASLTGTSESESGNDSVIIRTFAERMDEYNWMTDEIRRLLSEGEREIAILFRNNADASLLASTLTQAGIPFQVNAAPGNFLEHFTSLDMLAYMRAALSISDGRTPALHELTRIINRPVRYILRDSLSGTASSGNPANSRDCINSMNRFYAGNTRMLGTVGILAAHLRMLAGMTPFAGVKYIRNVIGYDKWLQEYAGEKGADTAPWKENLEMFEEFAGEFNSFSQLEAALDSSSSRGQLRAQGRQEGSAPVQIMTMHASKGLEFNVVFIPDANDSIMPNKRSESLGMVNEERRLFYVAMTRARRKLYITYPTKLHNKSAMPTRFLNKLLQTK